jgi:hypothetical protein
MTHGDSSLYIRQAAASYVMVRAQLSEPINRVFHHSKHVCLKFSEPCPEF